MVEETSLKVESWHQLMEDVLTPIHDQAFARIISADGEGAAAAPQAVVEQETITKASPELHQHMAK